ncbi:hypothetical protein HOD08_03865 [bacterium]|jgi:hypothetical protein|nr:hypothetical protein [bacterium]
MLKKILPILLFTVPSNLFCAAHELIKDPYKLFEAVEIALDSGKDVSCYHDDLIDIIDQQHDPKDVEGLAKCLFGLNNFSPRGFVELLLPSVLGGKVAEKEIPESFWEEIIEVARKNGCKKTSPLGPIGIDLLLDDVDSTVEKIVQCGEVGISVIVRLLDQMPLDEMCEAEMFLKNSFHNVIEVKTPNPCDIDFLDIELYDNDNDGSMFFDKKPELTTNGESHLFPAVSDSRG